MEYGKIINRSASIVWQNKFLMVVGILAAIGSGFFGGSGGGGGGGSDDIGFGDPGQFSEFGDEIATFAIGVVIVLICIALFIGIVLWVISTVARGGLIASVNSIEAGEKSSFRLAWGAGWEKLWTLLGISLLPAIPALIMFVVGLLGFAAYGGIFALFGEEFTDTAGLAGLGSVFAILACIFVPIMLALMILRNFAERACMLEDQGVIDAYRRGANVLMENIGQAIILILLQIAIFIVLGLLLFLPGLFALLCCCLWPLLLLLQGAIEAFVSALWTLAWRTWTGEPPMVEKAPTTA
ncbi:MAG TPA: hypothetical protein VLE70_06710 [Anaerolineae bacterium]|jgi:hypothetical protein|nr:hypothetical protein [Anaerolineae bacterium]